MGGRRLCISALFAVGLVFALLPVAASAGPATVVLPIRVTVDNGGPVATGIVLGCFASPSTIAFDGAVHFFTVDPSCAVTILQPSPGLFSRYQFGLSTSTKVTSCASGLCSAANRTVYYQLRNKYVVVAKTQANFDPLLVFKVTGTVGGFAPRIVCSIATKVTDTTRSCAGWSDYKREGDFPTQPVRQAPGVNWQTSSQRAYVDTLGNSTHTANYAKHVALRVSYGVASPKGTGYSAPIFSFLTFGSASTYTASIKTMVNWVDFGSVWSMPSFLVGSGPLERWSASTATSGTATGASTVRPVYYHQYNDTYKYSVSDTSTPPAPTVSYRQFKSTILRVVPAKGFADWTNAGTSAVFPKLLTGSNTTSRWAVTTTAYPSAKSAVFNPGYYHQYWVTFVYTTADTSVMANGAVLGTYSLYGKATYPITSNGLGGVSPASAWVDGGTNTLGFSIANAPAGGERWAVLISPDMKSIHSSTVVTESGYYHQFGLTVSFSLIGGGNPTPPAVTCNAFGVLSTTTLTVLPKAYWCDLGGTWSISPVLLGGSGLSERWQTVQTTNGAVSAPQTIGIPYYHQYLMGFSRTFFGGGTPPDPTVTYMQFGGSQNTPATLTGGTVWVDAGSSYVYTNPTSGSTSIERWAAALTPAAFVVSSATINPSYYHQYSMVFAYTTNDGSTTPLNVNFVQAGVATKINATIAGATAWGDAGTTYTYTNPSSGSTSTNHWSSATILSGTVTASATVTTVYFHQVMVTFKFTTSDGSSPVNGPLVTYISTGSPTSVVATTSGASVWADGGSTYTYASSTTGSSAGERWMAAAIPTGTVTSTTAPSPVYYHQYQDTLEYTVIPKGGYSYTVPIAPMVTYTSFGLASSQSAATGPTSLGWVDATTVVNYPSTITDGIITTWTTATTTFTANSSQVLSPTYT